MSEGYYLKIGSSADLKDPKERRTYRFLEMFPGILSWGALILAGLFSFITPFFVAVFAILFDFYWFSKAIYLSFHLRAGFNKMKEHEKINWLLRLKQLQLKHYSPRFQKWQDIYHLVILPNYKEPVGLIRESLLSVLRSDYPKEKIIVVLAFEQRAGEQRKDAAEALKKEFEDKFFKFLITWHPADLPDEMPGKGSNTTWAVKKAKEKIIDQLKIPYENIIVSCFDTDTVVSPKYFSCLAYHYLTSEKPFRTSFQPIPLYVNNINRAPLLLQTFAFTSTFWQIMCQERPEKLITFSSHSMSFKALAEVDFWQTNIVSEDSRIFWQCFLKYNGDYRVQPLYYPVSMDANVAKSPLKTLINIYKQQRRWAWGAENIFYFLFGCLKNKKIPLKKKLSLGFEIVEGHWSWAAAPVLIFCLGWLPILLGGEHFSHTLLSFNLPKITSWILSFSMLGLLFSVYYSILLFPKKPLKQGRLKNLTFCLGWLFIPLMMIFFGSLPALDAQTRWMLGKPLAFWPTEKIR